MKCLFDEYPSVAVSVDIVSCQNPVYLCMSITSPMSIDVHKP
jgi:hypothetical protein